MDHNYSIINSSGRSERVKIVITKKCMYKDNGIKCNNVAYKIPGIRKWAKYCECHLLNMEIHCIERDCNREPWYGIDGKVLVCNRHIGDNYEQTRSKFCVHGMRRFLCENLDCTKCFYRSFASHFRACCWSKKNDIDPRFVTRGICKKYWFDCDFCPHDFDCRIDHVASRGVWCKYCAVSSDAFCDDDNCDHCYNRSFASYELDTCEWSDLNTMSPNKVSKRSGKKCWFKCKICNHTFDILLSNMVCHGQRCSYCAGKICKNDCDTCYEKSFASSEGSKMLTKNNKVNPRHISKSSNIKLEFQCDYCSHIFITSARSITHGTSCPLCKNKTERKVFKYFKKQYPSVVYQAEFDWCRTDNGIIFKHDFYIPEFKTIIELDGDQHFKQVGKWKSPEFARKNDVYKMKCALDNGVSVIRILQPAVLKESYDWRTYLDDLLYIRDEPTVICQNDTNMYNLHLQDLEDLQELD